MTWFLVLNKRGGGKDGPFLINVVDGITELWVENSQKINCRDVTSIREGRVDVCKVHINLQLCLLNSVFNCSFKGKTKNNINDK